MKEYFRLSQKTKIVSDASKFADEGNSSTKTKKNSLEFASRTRKFLVVWAAVCIGNSAYPRTFQFRMFVEVSGADYRLLGYVQVLRLLSRQM